ncbi:MAG: 3-deoxy-manno-octulosonate cytidylyltransferase [Thiotrichales bacterium]|nr:3-deoxy-manno-octulosonate cytidylyltransferase [Thiotrichales bacterium]MCY4351222.1 3-deoxy-manno-octulosonate cytidylyltransferase [Thiotrichales bacterium]
MNCLVVIPARYASARLPGKPLADIAGKPMVIRVHERAVASGVGPVVVATDDERVVAVARASGADVVLTSRAHASGTDRIAEVAAMRGLGPETVVVNVQGDEPLLPPSLIEQVASNLSDRPNFAIASLCEAIEREEEIFDPGVVKVVFGAHGRAAYFSRAPIPYRRKRFDPGVGTSRAGTSRACAAAGLHYRHIGLYAYRAKFLARFASLAPVPSELAESLEQLRAIHHGFPIHMEVARERPGPGVDTPADLERVRAIFEAMASDG